MAKKEKKQKQPIEKVSGDGNSGLARALASSEFHTRENGLQSMTLWLTKKGNLTENDLMRLWKAIFFCFWHSDSVPVQTALAERLSEIMLQLPENVGEIYFKTFIMTMRREWFGIDHLRLDKFMMLVRKFYSAHLQYLQTTKWKSNKLKEYASFWLNQVLVSSNKLVTAGFSYHICDLLLPQLKDVVAAKPKSWGGNTTFRALLGPYCTALAVSHDKALINRLRQGVFEPIIEAVREKDESVVYTTLDVLPLATDLFDLGAKKETRALNRQVLYALSTALESAAKKQSKLNLTPKSKLNGHAAVAPPEKEERQQEQEVEGSSKKNAKKDKKRKSTEPSTSTPVVAAAAAGVEQLNEVIPPSQGSKKKKSKKNNNMNISPQAITPTTAAAPTPATGPTSSKSNKKNSQQQKHSASPKDAAPNTIDDSPRKKAVRFSLKNNLVMTIGGPKPDIDTRTPPRAKPKGPALKKDSSVSGGKGPGRLQKSRLAKSSGSVGTVAPPGSVNTRKTRSSTLVSPHALPRSRASEFF